MATAIMKQKEVPEMDDVEEIISKISEESPYKRRPTQKRTWMTVPEMGKLLGLKKTDRYWLVHKNVFESKEIAGKIRINIASFEKWYLTCVQNEHKLGKKSRELLGEQVGISSVQVTRYIRLTELIPELLDLVDNKSFSSRLPSISPTSIRKYRNGFTNISATLDLSSPNRLQHLEIN